MSEFCIWGVIKSHSAQLPEAQAWEEFANLVQKKDHRIAFWMWPFFSLSWIEEEVRSTYSKKNLIWGGGQNLDNVCAL